MREDSGQPSLGVGTAIIQEGKILLTKRRDFPVWCIPGGHLYPGESILEAAQREAKEETGLEVSLEYLLGVYSMPHKWENGSCEIIFKGSPIGGALLRESTETVDAGFFSSDEIPETMIGWQVHQAADALKGRQGVVAVLDARLSMSQFREIDSRIKGGEEAAASKWFEQVCTIPSRVDLTSV